MTLITKPIPNFYGGVSQQTAVMRRDNQVQSAVNANFTVTEGMTKRPNTEFVEKINTAATSGAFIFHMKVEPPVGVKIKKDMVKDYVVVITDDATTPIEIYRIDGVECKVFYGTFDYLTDNAAVPTFTSRISVKNYLTVDATVTAPFKDVFKASSVSDYMVITNTYKKTLFKTAANGGISGGVIKGTVQTFSDLPKPDDEDEDNPPVEGQIYHIIGKDSDSFQGYYVKYTSGSWVETVKPGIYSSFDEDTFPHRLIYWPKNDELSFIFAPCVWSDRRVGDYDTQDLQSFMGEAITNVVFFRNRLGLLTKNSIALSRVNTHFDFFLKTALDILDDDPIDVSEDNGGSAFRGAITYNKDLLVMSDKRQYHFGSGSSAILTPKTAAFTATTQYMVDSAVNPVRVGASVYFACPDTHHVRIREYFIQPDSLVEDAADVTAHVPDYIPVGGLQMATISSLDILFVHSDADPDALYVYKYFWVGNEKVQSAWFKWEFDCDILAFTTVDSMLYMVNKLDSDIFLVKIDLENNYTGSLNFKVHVDNMFTETGTYDAETGKTAFQLPANTITTYESAAMGVVGNSTVLALDSRALTAAHTDYTIFDLTTQSVGAVADSGPNELTVNNTNVTNLDYAVDHLFDRQLLFERKAVSGWENLQVESSDYIIGTRDFTIECWINLSLAVTPATKPYITASNWEVRTNNINGQFRLGVNDEHTFGLVIRGDTPMLRLITPWFYLDEDTVKPDGTEIIDALYPGYWTHVAVTRKGSEWIITRNGYITGKKVASANITTGYNFNFGCRSYNTGPITNIYLNGIRMTIGDTRYRTSNLRVGDLAFSPPSHTYAQWKANQFIDRSNFAARCIPYRDITRDAVETIDGQDYSVKLTSPVSISDGYCITNFAGLEVVGSNQFNLGQGNFTIDFWANPGANGEIDISKVYPINSIPLYTSFYHKNKGSYVKNPLSPVLYFDYRVALNNEYNTFKFYYADEDDLTALKNLSWSIDEVDDWTHFALVRYKNKLSLFVDGVNAGDKDFTYGIRASTSPLTVQSYGGCNFDYLRVDKIARWTHTSTFVSLYNLTVIDPTTGEELDNITSAGDSVYVLGNKQDGKSYIIGTKYKMEVELTNPIMQDQRDNSIISGRLQLRNLSLAHQNTGDYTIEVTPKGRTKITHSFVAPNFKAALTAADNALVGIEKWMIRTNSFGAKVKIISESNKPVQITSGAFQATFNSKAEII